MTTFSLFLVGTVIVGVTNREELHLLAKTSDVVETKKEASKNSAKKEAFKDSSGMEASKDSSEEEASIDLSGTEASKDSSEEETSKNSSETEASKDSTEEKDVADTSEKEEGKEEKETDKESSEKAPTVISPEKEVIKDSSEQTANKVVEKPQEKPAEQKSEMTKKPAEQATDDAKPKDENLATLAKEELEDNYYFSVIKNQTTEEFIDTLKKDASEIAWQNDLYASVMIAQAILETGSGNSALSSEPNYNLFGVKGSYDGASVMMKTNEDDGNGNLFMIQSAFRKYPSYRESLEDYAALLKGGISGNPTFYQNTWKSKSKAYTDVTAFLTGRYATDIHYAKKLNAIITTYRLTQYDVQLDAKQKDKEIKQTSQQKENQTKVNQQKNEVEAATDSQSVSSKSTEKMTKKEGINFDEEEQIGLMKRKIQEVSSDTNILFKGQ